jgi:hypothetical protein
MSAALVKGGPEMGRHDPPVHYVAERRKTFGESPVFPLENPFS